MQRFLRPPIQGRPAVPPILPGLTSLLPPITAAVLEIPPEPAGQLCRHQETRDHRTVPLPAAILPLLLQEALSHHHPEAVHQVVSTAAALPPVRLPDLPDLPGLPDAALPAAAEEDNMAII